MATLAPWQMSYNGLTFGASTEIALTKIDGLRGLPEIRSNDSARPRADGMLAGLDFAGVRTITLTLTVVGQSAIDLETQLSALDAAFTHQVLTPLPLQYAYGDGANKVVYCRPRKRTEPLTFNYQAAYYAEVTIELATIDPRIYAVSTSSVNISLPIAGTGIGFSIGPFPIGFGSNAIPNTGTLTSYGNYTTPLTATINGPCTYPVITNNTTGSVVASTIVLASTDSLVISMDAHTMLLNNQSSRRNTLIPGSIFFNLTPGATSVSFTSSDAVTAAGNVTFTWQDAWI